MPIEDNIQVDFSTEELVCSQCGARSALDFPCTPAEAIKAMRKFASEHSDCYESWSKENKPATHNLSP